MTAPGYLPETGDPIRMVFDPTKGREQAGRRPAPVVSPAVFTENTGLAIVCPITSRVRPFPTSVVLPSNSPIAGEILSPQAALFTSGTRQILRGHSTPLDANANQWALGPADRQETLHHPSQADQGPG